MVNTAEECSIHICVERCIEYLIQMIYNYIINIFNDKIIFNYDEQSEQLLQPSSTSETTSNLRIAMLWRTRKVITANTFCSCRLPLELTEIERKKRNA